MILVVITCWCSPKFSRTCRKWPGLINISSSDHEMQLQASTPPAYGQSMAGQHEGLGQGASVMDPAPPRLPMSEPVPAASHPVASFHPLAPPMLSIGGLSAGGLVSPRPEGALHTGVLASAPMRPQEVRLACASPPPPPSGPLLFHGHPALGEGLLLSEVPHAEHESLSSWHPASEQSRDSCPSSAT